MTCPFGNLGSGYTGVQPPYDARVPEVIRPFHQECYYLLRGEGQRPYFPPDLPPGRRLDRVALLAAEETAIACSAELLDAAESLAAAGGSSSTVGLVRRERASVTGGDSSPAGLRGRAGHLMPGQMRER